MGGKCEKQQDNTYVLVPLKPSTKSPEATCGKTSKILKRLVGIFQCSRALCLFPFFFFTLVGRHHVLVRAQVRTSNNVSLLGGIFRQIHGHTFDSNKSICSYRQTKINFFCWGKNKKPAIINHTKLYSSKQVVYMILST